MPATSRLTVAAPVVIAVAAFGLPYGVLATAAGFPAWLTVVMSIGVFAGSAQFAAVSVLGAGGDPVAAIVAGTLLNTRYLATGAAAARVLPGGRLRRFVLAQLVVDESYALGVGAGSAKAPDANMMVQSGAAVLAGWIAGSAVGALIGPVLGDPRTLGLDAAFPALFVALLWPLLDNRRAIRSAVAGVAVALAVNPLAGDGIALAAAAVGGLVAFGERE